MAITYFTEKWNHFLDILVEQIYIYIHIYVFTESYQYQSVFFTVTLVGTEIFTGINMRFAYTGVLFVFIIDR